MAKDNVNPESPQDEASNAVSGKEIDDFFQRLPNNFRWPKPDAEAVAAAVEAIQRISGAAAAQDLAAGGDTPGNTCASCGRSLPSGSGVCSACGGSASALHPPQPFRNGAQHHYHHHYHHFVSATPGSQAAGEAESGTPRGKSPGAPGTAPGGRAESGARQVMQNWAQACNTRHIDDLMELYLADATLIRSSVPPVRSLPAIREYLVALLEAGLGDVETESLRLEMLGDIALDLGRCKMLVPVAMGRRREERGKYMVVLVRQPAGNWKILADCWSSDPTLSAAPPESARKGVEPVVPQRKPR